MGQRQKLDVNFSTWGALIPGPSACLSKELCNHRNITQVSALWQFNWALNAS